MPTTCEIQFENNPMKVVYAGQLLRGTVCLTLTGQKDVRGVYIEIRGKAYARWTEGTGDNRKTYTGSEDYLNERTYFVGGTSGEVCLTPGTYNYTFQCMLPHGLPTSVEGEYGHIRYTARVVLDIPMWPDKEFEVPFTVIKGINLNAIPALREPVIREENKTFFLCCLLCCCSSDPMRIVARTPVGGYCPGQTINLEINVHNQSDQPVSEFSVQLIKQIDYYIYANSSRQKHQTISITEQDTRGCDVNQNEIIRVNIEVPPIPPTDFSTSNIVKVQYSLRIIGSVACCHNDPELNLPITIGSYPIQDNASAQTMFPYPNSVTMPQGPIGFSNDIISQQPTAPLIPPLPNPNPLIVPPSAPPSALPSAPPPQFPNDDLPPTYEEAIHGENFKPKYPMFKRTTSYSSGN